MPEPSEDFSSTMRIDLTPDEAQLRADDTRILRRSGKRVIRIQGRSSEQRRIGDKAFNTLLQNIYDAVLITDLDGNILHVNERARQILGYSEDDLCQSNLCRIVEGADQNLIGTILTNLKNDRFTIIQAHCLHQTGQDFPAEITANRLTLDRDYLSFFLRDISRRIEIEARLRTGFNAIQNAVGGIGVTDAEGRLIYLNPTLHELLGYTDPLEAIDRPLTDFCPDVSAFKQALAKILSGKTFLAEWPMLRHNGVEFFARFSAAPNYDREGDISGLVLSVEDITDARKAHEQRDRLAREIQGRNEEYERDLHMAREIQQAVLTRTYPDYVGGSEEKRRLLSFAHGYEPCGLVGGDFFSILPISDDWAGLFIADVSGHGLKAALVVATLRGLFEELKPLARNPDQFLFALNKAYSQVFSLSEQFMFTTAFFVAVNARSGQLRYASAGHPPAWLLSTEGSHALCELPGSHGPGLGLYDSAEYPCGETTLKSGDRLLLYTDGLIEAENPDGEMFEEAGWSVALESLASLPLSAVPHRLLDAARIFSQSDTFRDDVCVLVMEYAPGNHES